MGAGDLDMERAQPILRWAGGKRWLLRTIREVIGDTPVARYHEPFLGGAAVFLGIRPGTAFLSDLNEELVATYRCIRDYPEAVFRSLEKHENAAEHYYALRSARPEDEPSRAARFIFLNHTSFNGIYRVNLRGTYNVPYGNRTKINPPDHIDLLAVASRLRTATLSTGDFSQTVERVQRGDLVFLDPPYTVAHNQNGFVKYNQKLFSFDDQKRLSQYIDQVKQRAAFYIMTNAAHYSIANLFEKGDRRMVTRRRNNVGGADAARGTASEFLFTNLPSND